MARVTVRDYCRRVEQKIEGLRAVFLEPCVNWGEGGDIRIMKTCSCERGD